ncbi:MAG: hypothetical protein N2Z82_02840, partial [Thermomicrobium sp.]|nr:hypothetical protein [Thermomicrobium sp.]
MKRIAGRVPVELGIVAAEFAFRLALGREVGLIEAEGRERADRLLALLWEVYSRYLQPTASDAGRPGG